MKVKRDINLKDYTTIGISSLARGIVWIEGERDRDVILKMLEEANSQGLIPYVLGKGSNIVPGKEELPFMFFSLLPLYEPYVIEEEEARSQVKLRVHGGISLKRLLLWCRRKGLSGLEPLAGIPGTIGGAIAMNAGSFGGEMSHVVLRVRIWSPSLGDRWFERDELSFGYRSFSFPHQKGPFIVWETDVLLSRADKGDLRDNFRKFYFKKKQSQPLTQKSCGCLFKNPPQGSAGYLLDRCGLKGFKVGDMQLSELHANFLINRGKGTPSQTLELVEEARERVKNRFGCMLEPEVRILGWKA